MVNGKNVVCPNCTKSFRTSAALSQHRLAAHAGVHPQPMVAVKKVAKKTTRKTRQSGGGAPVSVGVTVKSANKDYATLSGTDRFASIGDISDAKDLIVNKLIVPGAFERLRHVAKAFQRIRYNYIRFRITPQVSTACSGGYVAGFIKDPADVVPKDGLLNYLTAQSGSVTTKWWQSAVISMPKTQTNFYTSEGVEIRDYSPGRFVMAVDGAATQKGNLTVFCEWSVTLSAASLETDQAVTPVVTALINLYSVSAKAYVGYRKDKTATQASPNQALSTWRVGGLYKLPWPVAMQESTTVTRNIWYIKVVSSSEMRWCREDYNDEMPSVSSEVFAIPAGTILDEVSTVQNFHQQASSSADPSVIEDPNCSGAKTYDPALIELLTNLNLLMSQLRSSKEPSCRQREDCSLKESSKLTGSQQSLGEYSLISDEAAGAPKPTQ